MGRGGGVRLGDARLGEPRRVGLQRPLALLGVGAAHREHVARIRALLSRHRDETSSAVAERLLQLTDEELRARFTTIMPRDYARVLRARAEAEQAGLDEAATTKMMMEASHG